MSGPTVGSLSNNGQPPSSSGDSLKAVCASFHRRINDFLESKPSTPLLKRVQGQTKIAVEVCQVALKKYSLEEIALSYNGGKDCLVLVIAYLAALHTHYNAHQDTAGRAPSGFPETIKTVYIQPPNPFTEVDDFVKTSSQEYHMALTTELKPMKEAFEEYLQVRPEVKAIFVGTRRTDPHGGSLTHFDKTDHGWPKFMRIHPVIDWKYQEIWAFIRQFDIPYCKLYDLGYTSLGGTKDTHPNPALLKTNKDPAGQTDGSQAFEPAWKLLEDDEERLGRDR